MLDHSSMMFPETAHFSGRVVHADDSYTVEQYIVGITDNYDDALAILKKHPYPTLNITKRNQPIEIPAGFYTE